MKHFCSFYYAQPIRLQGLLLQVNLSRYKAEKENRALEEK